MPTIPASSKPIHVPLPPSDPADRPAAYPPLVIDFAEGQPDLARHLKQEWHLTNGLGGFAMGTPVAIPTRRYHGLLVAATRPPVGRIMALSAFVETLCLTPPGPSSAPPTNGSRKLTDARPGEQRIEFSSFAFPGAIHPAGHAMLRRFEKDVACRWYYQYGPVQFIRELVLVHHRNEAIIRYRIKGHPGDARLELRPLVALRDFHDLVNASRTTNLAALGGQGSVEVARGDLRLSVACGHGCFVQDREWWYNFEYARDRERGQDHREDLFSPGRFVIELQGPGAPAANAGGERAIELRALAALTGPVYSADSAPSGLTFHQAETQEAARVNELAGRMVTRAQRSKAATALETTCLRDLAKAADQFIVLRDMPAGAAQLHPGAPLPAARSVTIIAGYPWFSDWGRDSMISLPGLLLATDRLAEAGQVLETFAALTRRGLVPNCFDNGSGAPEYNTVDASLWYLHAAAQYRRAALAAGQRDPVHDTSAIRKTCLAIIDAYKNGTDYQIRTDPADGLVTAGDAHTQLTWMDARRDGIVFTPRHGKPVEINSLWYSGLLEIATMVESDRPRLARDLQQHAARVAESFRTAFWNTRDNCLFDVLTPTGPRGWLGVPEIRPNQIFAVSLPHSPLAEPQQEAVLRTVREHLLTPMGLRTLSPRDRRYIGRFEGSLFDRDKAYHNGTVWPWLLGPYASAVLRVGKQSPRAAAEARRALEPLLAGLRGQFLGQLAEIYDGDDSIEMPQRADGCSAQAWSVAEALRVVMDLCSIT